MAESQFSESSWRSALKWLKSRATSSWHGIATDLYNSINWGCITEKGLKEKSANKRTNNYSLYLQSTYNLSGTILCTVPILNNLWF